MEKVIDLSIIIVSFNTKKLLIDCINSIRRHVGGLKYEVIIIDNGSSDGSTQAISNIKHQSSNLPAGRHGFKLIENKENLGFGKANNQGMKIAKGRYILLLNSDTLISSNVLGEMISWMGEHKDVGIASCSLKNKDGSIQGTGGYFPTLARVFSWMTIQDLPFVDNIIKPFHPMHTKSFYKEEEIYKSEK